MQVEWIASDYANGRAQYTWRREGLLELPWDVSRRDIVKICKRAAGYKGKDHFVLADYGDAIHVEFTPSGLDEILLINLRGV